MKRAKRMEALSRQRRIRKIMKGLNDIKAGRVFSEEQVEAETNVLFAILEAKQAGGAMLFKRRARRWREAGIDLDE